MIKCDREKLEMAGQGMDLVSETTLILKGLFRQIPRELSFPTILASIYLMPDLEDIKKLGRGADCIDVRKATELFKEDTKATLKFMEVYSKAPGRTFKEKCEEMEKRRNNNE